MAAEQEQGKGAPEGADAESPAADEAVDAAPKEKGKGKLGLILGIVAVTLLAGGLGGGLGYFLAGSLEAIVIEKTKAQADKPPPRPVKYSGDLVLHAIEPVITNLAKPADVWVRMETAMVFANGAVENPDVTAAEIRQDIMSYLRTVTLDQLEGPSALQHLREDLNERVALRTNNQVNELIIETLVVQ